MKSIAQQLVETADALSLHSPHTAKLVKAILKEDAGENLEGKLHRLDEMKKTLNIMETAPIVKRNGVSDNFDESFSAKEDQDALLKVAEAAKQAFGLDDRAARLFAGLDTPNTEASQLIESILKEN